MNNESFDWKYYISIYEDLRKAGINTKEKAWNHWIKYGIKENRICTIPTQNNNNIFVPKDFDFISYINRYDDLKIINNKKDAWIHWINQGMNESREIVDGFNWKFYINHYKLNNLKNYDDAYNHWINNGIMNNKLASPEFINYENQEQKELELINEIHPKICHNCNCDFSYLNIIYYVEETTRFPYNTGIQRVVRLLGKNLQIKTNLFLVKFDFENHKFINLNENEKRHLENFDGISYNTKTFSYNNINNFILLIPELNIGSNKLEPIINEAKKFSMKIVSIFYDDIPYLLPDECSYKNKYQTIINIKHLSKSDLILPISNYSTKRLLFHFDKLNIKNKKIIPIKLFGNFCDTERNYKYPLITNNNFNILCVGTIIKRKNQIVLIKAIELLKSKYNIKLNLVGNGINCLNNYSKTIKNIIETNNYIKLYENVNNNKLKELYLESHLTVFPSIEEGFGLPIMESIWYCRPCICMNYGSMNEISTAGCVKIDCNNINLLANTIESILTNEQMRNKLIDEIRNSKIRTHNEYSIDILHTITSNL